MKCSEIQELLGDYFDLPEHHETRQAVNLHLASCQDCTAELQMWEESLTLIRNTHVEEVNPAKVPPISNKVMDRIYATESWRMPVANRIYSIPFRLRRNLTAMIAFCLALFLISFLYAATDDGFKEATPHGFIPAASASGTVHQTSMAVATMSNTTLASTALIKPIKIGMLKSSPDYFLAMSLFGMIATLLIMNWLSRTRV
jgi:anti-sigma factor RsiW